MGTLLGPHAARLPAAILLIGVLPGAAVGDLVVRRFDDWGERAAVALGLSLAIVVLGALVLDSTVGITRTTVAVWLAGVTVAAAIAGAILRRGDSREPALGRPRLRISVVEVVVFLLAATLVVAAVVYARTPLHARGAKGYTALWIVRNGGRLRVGVESEELHLMSYRLVVRTSAARLDAWQLQLAPGGKWSATTARSQRPVEAFLYRRAGNNQWVVYRHVRAVP